MEELQNCIWEQGMRKAICEDTSESPFLVKFTVGMRDLILQQVPSHHYGTLMVILNPLVASKALIQQTTQYWPTLEKLSS